MESAERAAELVRVGGEGRMNSSLAFWLRFCCVHVWMLPDSEGVSVPVDFVISSMWSRWMSLVLVDVEGRDCLRR